MRTYLAAIKTVKIYAVYFLDPRLKLCCLFLRAINIDVHRKHPGGRGRNNSLITKFMQLTLAC